MDILCPSCGRKIPLEDVNVSTDLALCRACGQSFQFSDLADGRSALMPDLNSPPSGAWFVEMPDGFRAGATTRSWMAIFLVPFTCVWAGGSLGGIYVKPFLSGKLDPANAFFGLPFLVGSLFLVGLCAMTLLGKVSVTKTGDRLWVFTGVGGLGWTRQFSWSDFYTAREDLARSSYQMSWSGLGRTLALEGKRKITFGSMWSENRRFFVLAALREMLKRSNNTTTSSILSPRFR